MVFDVANGKCWYKLFPFALSYTHSTASAAPSQKIPNAASCSCDHMRSRRHSLYACKSRHLPYVLYPSSHDFKTRSKDWFLTVPPPIDDRTLRLKPSLFNRKSSAASLFNGSFAFGSKKRNCPYISTYPIQTPPSLESNIPVIQPQ